MGVDQGIIKFVSQGHPGVLKFKTVQKCSNPRCPKTSMCKVCNGDLYMKMPICHNIQISQAEKDNALGAQICPKCGENLENFKFCGSCGFPNPVHYHREY